VEILTESGESFSSEWVISSIHPKATFRLISDNVKLTPAFQTRLKNLKETDGIFGIYARCRNIEDLNPLSNYYFFRTSDPKKIFEYGEPKDQPPSVFTSMSRKKSDILPRRTLSLHSVCPYNWFEPWKNSIYGKRDDGYHKMKETVAAGVFSLVEKYRPDFRGHIEKYSTSTPLTNLHFNGSEEGSGFGIYHSLQNTGTRTIGPRTKISNLLLTGQNYLFPGLLGASISALRTCGHIIGIKPILGELRTIGGSK
jgi:all-trans-retinol 13,14-reductase